MLTYDSIAKAITSRHLMTPIDKAVSVPDRATRNAALETLIPHDFDQAPVVDSDGAIVGFVTKEDLQGNDDGGLPLRRLASECLIAADAPFGRILGRFGSARMVFVIEDYGIAGFITPSDLNKHPARTHFYLMLADLEMRMASVARDFLKDPSDALELLEPSRRRPIERRHHQNNRYGVDADVLTAFEFKDLLTVMQETGLCERFGVSAPNWRLIVEPLPSFRNDVMHPTREFLGARTIRQLIEHEVHLRLLLLSGKESPK